jgi:hypothetical protein
MINMNNTNTNILCIPKALALVREACEACEACEDSASLVGILIHNFADVRYAVTDMENELLVGCTDLALVMIYCKCAIKGVVREFLSSVHAIVDVHLATRLLLTSRMESHGLGLRGRDLGTLDALPLDILRRILD